MLTRNLADNLNKKTIWVLDDDEYILRALKDALELEGYNIQTFNEEITLKKSLEKNTPNVILIDILLRKGDGRRICKDLKRNQSTRSIPVVLISANSELKYDAFRSRADSYLKKPFTISSLIDAVNHQLGVSK